MNEIRHEMGNPVVTEGRSLPWLQDVDANLDNASDNFLTSWNFVYRDVVIVDENNEVVETYNLTQHNLANEANYNELKSKLVAAAEAVPTITWTNAAESRDVNNDGFISPIDALLVINELNGEGARQLPARTANDGTKPFWDVNADGFVSAIDALLVLNRLNENTSVARAAIPATTEPEATAPSEPTLAVAAAIDAVFGDDGNQGREKTRPWESIA